MRAFDRFRPLIRHEMKRLAHIGMGYLDEPLALRDRFVLAATLPHAELLTSDPRAKNFIRAEAGGLLFRKASPYLESCIPGVLAKRAIKTVKGLEFRWTQVDSVDIRLLFAIVAWIGHTRSDLPLQNNC